jgi:hypothetical protein
MYRRKISTQDISKGLEFVAKRARGAGPITRRFEHVEGDVNLEPGDKETVEQMIKQKDAEFPSKEVLVTDPVSGQKRYDTRKERESNAFITINTHQKPTIGKTEKAMQTAFELIINTLFSEEEMKLWVEIKEPYLSFGDVWTLDPVPEESIFKSMKVTPGIELGPINGLLHAHIVLDVEHYSMIRYNAGTLGRRAAELWRIIFPQDLQPDSAGRDIVIRQFIDAYEEEKRAGAINHDFTVTNRLLYAGLDPRVRLTDKGMPALSIHKRGFHRFTSIVQFKTFMKDQGLFNGLMGNRSSIEQKCRKYVAQNIQRLKAEQDRVIHQTKSMHCHIQYTQSNLVQNRMNYIAKNKAGAERGVLRAGSIGAGPVMS